MAQSAAGWCGAACVFRLDAVASARFDWRQLRRRRALWRCSRVHTGGSVGRRREAGGSAAWMARRPFAASIFILLPRDAKRWGTKAAGAEHDVPRMNLVEANGGTATEDRETSLSLPATSRVDPSRTGPIQRTAEANGWTVFHLPSTPTVDEMPSTPIVRRSSSIARSSPMRRLPFCVPSDRTFTFPHPQWRAPGAPDGAMPPAARRARAWRGTLQLGDGAWQARVVGAHRRGRRSDGRGPSPV
jgi:hypothetical protein